MIKFKVKANLSKIKKKVRSVKTNKSLGQFLADTAAEGMQQYVPYRFGTLSGSVRATPFKITYYSPYAPYVYYGKGMNFSKIESINATSEWDRAYAIAKGEQLGNAGTDFLKGM